MVAPTAPAAIQMTPVDSSKLFAVGYDDALFILRAEFKPSHSLYDYFDVPPERWAGLMKADSKGIYLGTHIVGPRGGTPPYRFAKVGTPLHDRMWHDALSATPLPIENLGHDQKWVETLPGTSPVEEARKGLETRAGVTELPRQKSRSQELAEVTVDKLPQVELPSDPEGLEERAATVTDEAKSLVLLSGSAPAALALKTPDHYALVMATILQKKEEKKRALAEVAKIKDPATAAWKAACEFERRVAASYDSAITLLDQACVGFRKEVAEEERLAAQAEQQERQRVLDAEHAERTRIANEEAAAHAENLRAAGQHEVAAEVEKAPAYVPRQVAAPAVQRTSVPAVSGARILKTWKFQVVDPTLVPRFYIPQIAQALAVAGFTGPQSEDRLGSFAMALGTIFAQLHSLDEVKIGGRVRPLKEAAVGLIPGVNVYADEKTSSTGR